MARDDILKADRELGSDAISSHRARTLICNITVQMDVRGYFVCVDDLDGERTGTRNVGSDVANMPRPTAQSRTPPMSASTPLQHNHDHHLLRLGRIISCGRMRNHRN